MCDLKSVAYGRINGPDSPRYGHLFHVLFWIDENGKGNCWRIRLMLYL